MCSLFKVKKMRELCLHFIQLCILAAERFFCIDAIQCEVFSCSLHFIENVVTVVIHPSKQNVEN